MRTVAGAALMAGAVVGGMAVVGLGLPFWLLAVALAVGIFGIALVGR